MKLENVATVGGFASGMLAQASTGPVEVGSVAGTLLALLVLVVRYAGDGWRLWCALEENKLDRVRLAKENGDLRARLVELEKERDRDRTLADRGVCPLTKDGSPYCGRHASPAAWGPRPDVVPNAEASADLPSGRLVDPDPSGP